MSTWAFSDGAILSSGGSVKGKTKTADALRVAVESKRWINVLPEPSGSARVDAKSDFLLDALARVVAYEQHQAIRTSYVSSIDDAPADVRTMIEEYEASPEADPREQPLGTVY